MMACQRAGFVPRSTQQAVNIRTVSSLVETGLGIALVPRLTALAPNEHLVYRPLADLADQPQLSLAMAWRPDNPKPAVLRMRQLALAAFGPAQWPPARSVVKASTASASPAATRRAPSKRRFQ